MITTDGAMVLAWCVYLYVLEQAEPGDVADRAGDALRSLGLEV